MTLLEALREIKTNGPGYPLHGLCANVRALVDPDEFERLGPLMDSWPENSGQIRYPVPHPDWNPQTAYYNTGPETMWNPDHPYGATRLRLLTWCIAQIEGQS